MEMKTILLELAGKASMCWEPSTGDAVFDSESAVNAVDEALKQIEESKTGDT